MTISEQKENRKRQKQQEAEQREKESREKLRAVLGECLDEAQSVSRFMFYPTRFLVQFHGHAKIIVETDKKKYGESVGVVFYVGDDMLPGADDGYDNFADALIAAESLYKSETEVRQHCISKMKIVAIAVGVLSFVAAAIYFLKSVPR